MKTNLESCQHPHVSRRQVIQAGSVGILGLGMNHLGALRAADRVAWRHRSKDFLKLGLMLETKLSWDRSRVFSIHWMRSTVRRESCTLPTQELYA